MSLDRSLRSANALVRHRNVLTRAERLEKLAEEEKWNESKSPFGLPKVAHRKLEVAKPVKEEAPAEGAAVPGAPGAAPAAGAAGAAAPAAAGGKAPAGKAGAAAPAAGGKAGAAPAAAGGKAAAGAPAKKK
jgi:small basic protein (TIGR04137 family)